MAAHGTFHWNERLTRDVEATQRFYRDTIGWTFEAMPMPNSSYWCAMMDGKPIAGLFPINTPDYEGVAEGWMPYLAVDDVDARVEAAVKAGATLMKPIFDVPGVGRIAILREPGGVGIGWMTPA